jgi:hypothetical protein
MIDALDKLAPEKAKYRHNAEGSDDMVPQPPIFGLILACTYQISVDWVECDCTHFGREIGIGNMAGNISL